MGEIWGEHLVALRSWHLLSLGNLPMALRAQKPASAAAPGHCKAHAATQVLCVSTTRLTGLSARRACRLCSLHSFMDSNQDWVRPFRQYVVDPNPLLTLAGKRAPLAHQR